MCATSSSFFSHHFPTRWVRAILLLTSLIWVRSGWHLCLSLNSSLITGWLLTVQHILNVLLKTLYEAHHWLWVSAGALGHRYENATSTVCTSNPSCSEVQAVTRPWMLLPPPAFTTWALARTVAADQCDCALQLSSFYKEKHFLPRN